MKHQFPFSRRSNFDWLPSRPSSYLWCQPATNLLFVEQSKNLLRHIYFNRNPLSYPLSYPLSCPLSYPLSCPLSCPLSSYCLEPLGPWIGINDQFADLSRPICPCFTLRLKYSLIAIFHTVKTVVFKISKISWFLLLFTKRESLSYPIATLILEPLETGSLIKTAAHIYSTQYIVISIIEWL